MADDVPALAFDAKRMVYDALQRRLDGYRQMAVTCLAGMLLILTLFDSKMIDLFNHPNEPIIGFATVATAIATISFFSFLRHVGNQFFEISCVVMRIEVNLGLFASRFDDHGTLLPADWLDRQQSRYGHSGWHDFIITALKWAILIIGIIHVAAFAAILAMGWPDR